MNIKIIDILSITLEQAKEVYSSMNVSFIVRDGKLKGMSTK